MSSVNASTSFSGFQLKSDFSPRPIPPPPSVPKNPADALSRAASIIQSFHDDVLQAKVNLLAAKIVQAHFANYYRSEDPGYKVGDCVWLNTSNRRHDYVHRGSGRAAKFMPRFDGPFFITKAYPKSSSYTLDLPLTSSIHPTFHVSLLQPFIPNDDLKFPNRMRPNPEPVLVDGEFEHEIEKIIDERKRGHSKQYLVHWKNFSSTDDEWIPHAKLADNKALDDWERSSESCL